MEDDPYDRETNAFRTDGRDACHRCAFRSQAWVWAPYGTRGVHPLRRADRGWPTVGEAVTLGTEIDRHPTVLEVVGLAPRFDRGPHRPVVSEYKVSVGSPASRTTTCRGRPMTKVVR